MQFAGYMILGALQLGAGTLVFMLGKDNLVKGVRQANEVGFFDEVNELVGFELIPTKK